MSWQFYWNPWSRDRRLYSVPLSPVRCNELLVQDAKSWPVWSHGKIARARTTNVADEQDLWFYRATFWYYNGFKPYVRVRIGEIPGGSSVEATLTSWWIQETLWTAWFGFFGLLTLFSFGSYISSGSWRAMYTALVGSWFIGVFLLMFASGRWLARHDPQRLHAYVRVQLGIAETATIVRPHPPDGQ